MNHNPAEWAVMKWMNARNIAYCRIDQEKDTFTAGLRHAMKRPDFIVLLGDVGAICVDVKNRKLTKYGDFLLDEERDIRGYQVFEEAFRMPAWFVFVDLEDHTGHTHWISLRKVLMHERIKNNGKGKFRAIPATDVVTLQTYIDPVGKLLTN